ncbi:MAG: TIGR03086 family protein [Actinobacteria bacterium]|nr:TIGR03086 family protein [Actinomycetota bacterium]
MKGAVVDVEMYERTLGRANDVVSEIKPEQLGEPSGCGDWEVRELLNHVVGYLNAFSTGANGEKLDVDGVDFLGDDHVAAYEKAAKDALEAFRGPGAMEKTFILPWGDNPGSMALGLALAEAAVHGWDLGRATGHPVVIDDDVAEAVYGMTSSMMVPLGQYPRGDSFAEPVEVPDSAPIADRMIAYLGRRP